MGLAALYPSYEVWPTAKHGVRCGFRSTAGTTHEPVPHQVHRAVDRRRGRARPRAQTLAQRLGPDDLGGGGGGGAGIFSVGARAAGDFAGPAVTVAFMLAALACALAIMCYAEFASTIPVAGSAYTYTYATLGEFLAWIIGWDLILELLTAAAVIAKYWGIYLATVFELFDVHIPTTF